MLGAPRVPRRAYRRDPDRQAVTSHRGEHGGTEGGGDTPRLRVGTHIEPLRSPCARFGIGSNCEPRGRTSIPRADGIAGASTRQAPAPQLSNSAEQQRALMDPLRNNQSSTALSGVSATHLHRRFGIRRARTTQVRAKVGAWTACAASIGSGSRATPHARLTYDRHRPITPPASTPGQCDPAASARDRTARPSA
jgi:hypothetical protein